MTTLVDNAAPPSGGWPGQRPFEVERRTDLGYWWRVVEDLRLVTATDER